MQVKAKWGEDVHLVVAGLTNTYSSYVTTYEEYGVQRYEGASTIFGPHTLDAYIQVGVALNCVFHWQRGQVVEGLGTLVQLCAASRAPHGGAAWRQMRAAA